MQLLSSRSLRTDVHPVGRYPSSHDPWLRAENELVLVKINNFFQDVANPGAGKVAGPC